MRYRRNSHFEEELTPEDLFNMFFGGGGFHQGVRRRRSSQSAGTRPRATGWNRTRSAFAAITPVSAYIIIISVHADSAGRVVFYAANAPI